MQHEANLHGVHQRLRRAFAELGREHEAIEHQSPFDLLSHRAHAKKLRAAIVELHAHLERLRARDVKAGG